MYTYPQHTSINTNYAKAQHDPANDNQGSSKDESQGSSKPDRKLDNPEHADHPEGTDRPEGADCFERADSPESFHRPEGTDCIERADSPESAYRPESADHDVTWIARTSMIIITLIGLITDWPLEIAAYISGDSRKNEPQNYFSCFQWVYVIIRFIVAIMGLLVQTITCLRRDRLDQDNIIQENNASKEVKCNETSQIFSAIIVPDVIILVIFIGLLVRKGISTHTDIIDLAEAVKFTKQPDKYMTWLFPILFIVYIFFSLGISVGNMFAFNITDNDVVLHSVWGSSISGSWKTVLIILSVLGFFAFDLMYAQFILRYAYQCEMIIYFLEKIKNKVGVPRKVDRYANQDDALNDVEKAYDFLKKLDHNGTAVGYIMLFTTLNAINSIINLLNEGNTVPQETAILARFLQWFFLTMCILHQAAKVNAASKTLHETGLPMYRRPILFDGNDENQTRLAYKHVSSIHLKANLFIIAVHPRLPYVIGVLTVFTLVLGSSFKWYEHIL